MAINVRQDDQEVYYCKGNALQKIGKYEDATVQYDKAIDIHMKNK